MKDFNRMVAKDLVKRVATEKHIDVSEESLDKVAEILEDLVPTKLDPLECELLARSLRVIVKIAQSQGGMAIHNMIENPTPENIAKCAEATGINPEKLEKIENLITEQMDRIQSGETPDLSEAIKEIQQKLRDEGIIADVGIQKMDDDGSVIGEAFTADEHDESAMKRAQDALNQLSKAAGAQEPRESGLHLHDFDHGF